MKKVFDNFYCKLFFIIIPFLNEISYLIPYVNPIMKLGLVLAAIYLVYDFFTRRETLKMNHITLMVLFLFAMGMGILLNMKVPAFKMNVIEFLYTGCSLLVLFQVSSDKTQKDIYREMTAINYILVSMITIAGIISLVLCFAKIQTTFVYHDYEYPVGMYNGRLVGIFRNSIYPTATIGIIAAMVQLCINRIYYEHKKNVINRLLIASGIINFMVFSLQASKGLLIGLFSSVFFVFLMYWYKCCACRPKRLLRLSDKKRLLIAIPASGVMAGITYCVMWLFRTINTYIMLAFNMFFDHSKLEQGLLNTQEYFDRHVSDAYGALTGRPYVWKTGITHFMQQPLFGYGPYTLANTIHPYEGSTEQLSHFHNIFVQTLVSTGSVGFIAFCALVVSMGAGLLKSLWTDNKRKDYMILVLASSMLIFLIVINMADTTILFMTKHSGFVFFIYLGYILALTGSDKKHRIDRPFFRLAEALGRKGE